MSVTELKREAINKISGFSTESELKGIINYLDQLSKEKEIDNNKIDQIFEEASAKYGNTLKKLAE